jgi:hypothetical protein
MTVRGPSSEDVLGCRIEADTDPLHPVLFDVAPDFILQHTFTSPPRRYSR